MGWGSGNLGGGGSGKLFATISVTYPEGSTLTCSDGKKTLKAKTTTGRWIFSIPYAATWVVTATDGDSEASKTVEITTEGQNVSVELSFRTYLYNAGDKCTAITGGWGSSGYSDAFGSYTIKAPTFNTSSVKLAVPSSAYTAVCGTTNKVKLTDFSTLTIDVSAFNSMNNTAWLIVNDDKTMWDNSENVKMIALKSILGKGKTALSIEKLTGSYYIAVVIFGSSDMEAQDLTFTAITLE